MIHMFQQQTIVIKALVETLKSQGLVQKRDLDAYEALFLASEARRLALELQVEEAYRAAGKVLGVTV
jgi:hypothetical protein